MVTNYSSSLRISTARQADRLTPAQKKFNTLTKRLDRQRKRLAEWQEIMPIYQEEVMYTFQPLRESYAGFQAMMVALLDSHYLNNCFTRLQREKVSHIILGICEELINDHGRDDLKTIANRHSDIGFDEQQELKKAMGEDVLRAMLESEFDLELGDVELDMDDPGGTVEKLGTILEEQQRKAEAKRHRRKKTARQLAKEQREKEEESRISQSIQVVYRQLVGALHPDREQDPEQHRRKTDLMQKVTVAYKNRDLLQLLELQLTVEQINQDEIDSISEDRLKYFNKILHRQSQELKQEIEDIELHMKAAGGFTPFESLTPKKLFSALRSDKKQLEFSIIEIQKDLDRFKDVRNVKHWLKTYELPSDMPDENFFSLFG
ncbi:MAG: molecular chaperone DnaJ [Gammaproteobacteria bacterium]|nr:MAG: molecular chaperone DnaJ [Gammaproteobacteria bacterium]